MNVNLKLTDNWFEAAGAGGKVKLGAGQTGGVTPMEALLMAAGGCSGLDIVSILAKMRQPLVGLEINVFGQRCEDHPKYFKNIRLEYIFQGKLEPPKVERAIELSLEKYCSVINNLAPKTNMEYEYSIED